MTNISFNVTNVSCNLTNTSYNVTNTSYNVTNTSYNVTNIKVGFKAPATGFPPTPLLLVLPTLSWIIHRNHNFKEIQAQIFLKSQYFGNPHARYFDITIHLNSIADYLDIFKLNGSFYTFLQSWSSLEPLNVSSKALELRMQELLWRKIRLNFIFLTALNLFSFKVSMVHFRFPTAASKWCKISDFLLQWCIWDFLNGGFSRSQFRPIIWTFSTSAKFWIFNRKQLLLQSFS